MRHRRTERRRLPARKRMRWRHPQKRHFDPFNIEEDDDDDEDVEIGGGSVDEESRPS